MSTILDTVGNSPLVQLKNLLHKDESEIYLKLEMTNPGGSIKDRSALYIVEEAEKRGWLKASGTIIESSSGNFGISLAMIGAAKGYHVIILVDPKTTPMNLAMLKAYGAEVIVVTEKDDCGSYHKTRIALANKLHREIPNSFRPDQCFNPLNGQAHYRQTASEIFNQCHGNIDTIVVSVSTGGQIGGISRFFREKSPNVKIIAVDAVGSTIFGGDPHSYLLPGMGLGWTPNNIDDLSRIDEVYKVPDEDAFMMCRTLVRHEGIMCGGSTGAALMVALKLAQEENNNEKIVCIAADNGERYLSTIYNDEWMNKNLLSMSTDPIKIRERSKNLITFSSNPIETANYKPELLELLDSPSRYLIEEKNMEVLA